MCVFASVNFPRNKIKPITVVSYVSLICNVLVDFIEIFACKYFHEDN